MPAAWRTERGRSDSINSPSFPALRRSRSTYSTPRRASRRGPRPVAATRSPAAASRSTSRPPTPPPRGRPPRAPPRGGAARRAGCPPDHSRRSPAWSSSPVVALVIRPILAGADPLPPAAVLHVPVDGVRQPVGESDARSPAQLGVGFGRVDGIAAVVAGAVLDVLDQLARLAQYLQ